MDGGVADTQPAITQAVSRRRHAAAVQHNAHNLRTPKLQAREPLSLWTVAWPLLLLFNTTRAHTFRNSDLREK